MNELDLVISDRPFFPEPIGTRVRCLLGWCTILGFQVPKELHERAKFQNDYKHIYEAIRLGFISHPSLLGYIKYWVKLETPDRIIDEDSRKLYDTNGGISMPSVYQVQDIKRFTGNKNINTPDGMGSVIGSDIHDSDRLVVKIHDVSKLSEPKRQIQQDWGGLCYWKKELLLSTFK